MIDFSPPGNDQHGNDPQYEIYNSRGGQLSPDSALVVTDEWKLKYGETRSFIFTVGNAIHNSGTSQPDLVAVLPKIKPNICELIQSQLNHDGVPNISKINLTPHPQEVPEAEVVTLPYEYGCVRTPDGYFYYHLLLER